jgi:hypothetical protein
MIAGEAINTSLFAPTRSRIQWNKHLYIAEERCTLNSRHAVLLVGISSCSSSVRFGSRSDGFRETRVWKHRSNRSQRNAIGWGPPICMSHGTNSSDTVIAHKQRSTPETFSAPPRLEGDSQALCTQKSILLADKVPPGTVITIGSEGQFHTTTTTEDFSNNSTKSGSKFARKIEGSPPRLSPRRFYPCRRYPLLPPCGSSEGFRLTLQRKKKNGARRVNKNLTTEPSMEEIDSNNRSCFWAATSCTQCYE